MPVTCRCSSCGATYQVDQQYAGRKIKCPKCAAAIVVAAAAESKQAAAAVAPKTTAGPKPLKTAARIEADVPPPVPPLRRPRAASEEPLVPGGLEIPGLDDVALSSSTRGRSVPKLPPKRKPALAGNLGLWIGVGVGAGGLIAAVAITLVVVLMSRATPDLVSREMAKLTEKPHTGEAVKPPAAPVNALILNWMESEREGGAVYVDGQEVGVPKSGEVKLPLPPRPNPYRIRIMRKGYEPVEFNRMSVEGQDQLDYTVSWTPLAPDYNDWLQDLDEAKSSARAHRMSILLVFDKSNSSEDSRRLAHIFGDRDFRQSLNKDYALVYVDLADTPEAKENVKDADRNRRLRDRFQVTEYPTVLMTDEDGRVLGFLGGFQKEGMGDLTISEEDHEGSDEETGPGEADVFEGGVKSFQRMLKQWHEMGAEIRKATANIKSLAAGDEKHKAIGKLLDLLEINDLDRFYRPQIAEWKAMLPEALRNRPVAITRDDCRKWAARFLHCMKKDTRKERKESLAQAVAKFDEWKKEKGGRAFSDHNMGVGFLFVVTGLLARTEQYQEAAKKCEEALALDPPGHLGEWLKYAHQMLLDKVEGLTGMGAGFCVAKGGFIVTTREVLRPNGKDAKKIMVRLPNDDKPIPAKFIAADPKSQIALLQAELPTGTALKPVALGRGTKLGERVCALGFPDSANLRLNRDKAGVTITQGLVSALPGAEDKNPDMQADCRITPGTYGGPLCDQYGVVVGMVHKRSQLQHSVDPFAFVIPCELLQTFLKKHLPAGAALPRAQSGGQSRGWDEVKEQLESSIVRVQCFE